VAIDCANSNVSARPNKLRIIGGQWRGRKLEFPPIAAIRPTPDRVRETVFNWLRDEINGAHCLDLFAGSGALGLESLSRGAARVVFVDREPAIKRCLSQTLQSLGANNGEVLIANAMQIALNPSTPFDIIFLDPPFGENLLTTIAKRLEANAWLAPHALIYLECAADQPMPELPANWPLIKSKKAGQVGYHLARRQSRE
jgi:16S rRNA (guanine966-N2)-methyltransferase